MSGLVRFKRFVDTNKTFRLLWAQLRIAFTYIAYFTFNTWFTFITCLSSCILCNNLLKIRRSWIRDWLTDLMATKNPLDHWKEMMIDRASKNTMQIMHRNQYDDAHSPHPYSPTRSNSDITLVSPHCIYVVQWYPLWYHPSSLCTGWCTVHCAVIGKISWSHSLSIQGEKAPHKTCSTFQLNHDLPNRSTHMAFRLK